MSFPMRTTLVLPALLLLCLSTASTAFAASAASAASAGEPARKGPNLYLSAAGVALMAGGGLYAYAQDREGSRDMRVYRRSAFTPHTEDYRARVEEHQRLTWMGLAGAALGGILLVVSF